MILDLNVYSFFYRISIMYSGVSKTKNLIFTLLHYILTPSWLIIDFVMSKVVSVMMFM